MSAPAPNPLAAALMERIARAGAITFADFMAAALYDPDHGYYGSGRAAIGRKGDFITSVSVGALFGRLLARPIAEAWTRLGQPARFTVIEQGAHEGTLAADILAGLKRDFAECSQAAEYVIVEPSAVWRARQEKTLAGCGKVRWVSALNELRDATGIFIANELLDAFPVHRVCWTGGEWRERYVAVQEGRFAWQDGPLSSTALADRLRKIELPLPEGYETEVNLQADAWVRDLGHALTHGCAYLIDYGYERTEYYRSERAHGTLSGYAGHTRAHDLLSHPGEIDLTAHVDFTSLIEAAESAGFHLETFTDQHRFLGALGAAHFAAEGADPAERAKELRGFKTLMHPELLGAAFKVVCLAKEMPAA
jgi:SAM-dependent MidA family methyltransferase